jgi:hypothetical protein
MLTERDDSTCVFDATAETLRVVELVPLVTPRSPPTSLPSAVALFTLMRPVVWFPDERVRSSRREAVCESPAKGNVPLSRSSRETVSGNVDRVVFSSPCVGCAKAAARPARAGSPEAASASKSRCCDGVARSAWLPWRTLTNTDSRRRSSSTLAKKNARSRTSGPPQVPPYCWRLKGGSDGVPLGATANALRESSASSRTKRNPPPLWTLVPDLLTMLTMPPRARPNSAEKLLRST